MNNTSTNDSFSPGLLQSGLTNFLSVTTSTMVYHPLRTLATLKVAKQPLSFLPKVLYRGWSFCVLGSHQFFLMGTCKDRLEVMRLKTKESLSLMDKIAIGAISGLMTTLTVTSCEAMTTQKQIGKRVDLRDRKIWYRGIVPISIRQVGLGWGMFVLPDLISSRIKGSFPENQEGLKMAISFLGGATAAAITHVPEFSRLLMQINPETYPTARKAFSHAWKELYSPQSINLFKIRVTVIAIATLSMHATKQFYSQKMMNLS